uniref:Uncharacterized protein n=1 Tax=Aegilops tauschii subsp. strangulata TaxID=200361 RepID=A0A453QT22_AEGTS
VYFAYVILEKVGDVLLLFSQNWNLNKLVFPKRLVVNNLFWIYVAGCYP